MMTEAATIEGDADWPYLKEEIPRAIEQAMDGLKRVATIVRGMKESRTSIAAMRRRRPTSTGRWRAL